MAPPHTTKKTTTTSRTAATTKGSRKSLTSQPKRIVTASSSVTSGTSEAMDVEHTEVEDSQSAPLQLLLVNLVDTQQKRHAARKTAVHKSYAKNRDSTKTAITSLFATHEAEAAQAFNAQISRLQNLMRQKNEVETVMKQKLAGLRNKYLASSEALQKVVEYRAKELR